MKDEKKLLLYFWDYMNEECVSDRREYTKEEQQNEIDKFTIWLIARGAVNTAIEKNKIIRHGTPN